MSSNSPPRSRGEDQESKLLKNEKQLKKNDTAYRQGEQFNDYQKVNDYQKEVYKVADHMTDRNERRKQVKDFQEVEKKYRLNPMANPATGILNTAYRGQKTVESAILSGQEPNSAVNL